MSNEKLLSWQYALGLVSDGFRLADTAFTITDFTNHPRFNAVVGQLALNTFSEEWADDHGVANTHIEYAKHFSGFNIAQVL